MKSKKRYYEIVKTEDCREKWEDNSEQAEKKVKDLFALLERISRQLTAVEALLRE